jgi:N-acyl homoserine lactone hydrolase
VRLYLLRFGHYPGDVPVVGYLIQTAAGTNVLVDTGFPRGWEGEERYVVDLLASIGIASEEVHYVICSHLDEDHASGHDAFPFAEFVVQRRHYEMAQHDSRYDNPSRASWDRAELRYRLVDGDVELLPGLELIETSGHVPGHQSVLVQLPRTGPVLLAIDAIKNAQQLDPATRSVDAYDMDEVATRASTRRLVELAEREGVKLIVFGHDAQQWATLKKAPEYYD